MTQYSDVNDDEERGAGTLAIVARVASIHTDIKNVKEDIDELKNLLNNNIKAHDSSCPAKLFLIQDKRMDKILAMLYNIEYCEKESKKRAAIIKAVLSLPIVGFAIERLVNLLFDKKL